MLREKTIPNNLEINQVIHALSLRLFLPLLLRLQTFAHALGDSVPFSPRRSSVFSASNPNWKRVAASDHPGNVFILLVDIGRGKKRGGRLFLSGGFFFLSLPIFTPSFLFRSVSQMFLICAGLNPEITSCFSQPFPILNAAGGHPGALGTCVPQFQLLGL